MKPRRKNTEHERRATPKGATRDFHRSPPEAVDCLLRIEGARLRQFDRIREMACGDGALVLPLRRAGFVVDASDIENRRCPGQTVADYLKRPAVYRPGVAGVTNPPFNCAEEFILKACAEFDYVAFVLRLRYVGAKHQLQIPGIDDAKKSPIWANTRIPFARVIIPDGRWPMMHRDGYEGPKTDNSPTDFGWFIWDRQHNGFPQIVMEAQINAAEAAGRNAYNA